MMYIHASLIKTINTRDVESPKYYILSILYIGDKMCDLLEWLKLVTFYVCLPNCTEMRIGTSFKNNHGVCNALSAGIYMHTMHVPTYQIL